MYFLLLFLYRYISCWMHTTLMYIRKHEGTRGKEDALVIIYIDCWNKGEATVVCAHDFHLHIEFKRGKCHGTLPGATLVRLYICRWGSPAITTNSVCGTRSVSLVGLAAASARITLTVCRGRGTPSGEKDRKNNLSTTRWRYIHLKRIKIDESGQSGNSACSSFLLKIFKLNTNRSSRSFRSFPR